jgi:tRNA modification GTPase
VEQLGVERSRAALVQADLALLVLDATAPVSRADLEIAALTHGKPTILVWNKLDAAEQMVHHAALDGGDRTRPALAAFLVHTAADVQEDLRAHPSLHATLGVSTQTEAGLDELAQAVAAALLGGAAAAGNAARLVSNPRHRDALHRAEEHLAAALAGWEARHPTDLLGGDLTAALNALGEITGESVGDDLLDLIFSRFCIGK